MSLCPESEYRAGLSDEDFWAHVFGQDGPDDYDPANDPYAPEPDVAEEWQAASPCAVCGTALGACAYDPDGNAMIHVQPEEEGS